MTHSFRHDIRDAARTFERLDDLFLAIESVAFCKRVHMDYLMEKTEPNEHMDRDRAHDQLMDAIDRMLKAADE